MAWPGSAKREQIPDPDVWETGLDPIPCPLGFSSTTQQLLLPSTAENCLPELPPFLAYSLAGQKDGRFIALGAEACDFPVSKLQHKLSPAIFCSL